MENTAQPTSAALLATLNAADPATADYKAFALEVITALGVSEANAAGLQTQLDEADTAYNAAIEQITELGTKLDLQEKNKDTKGILVTIGDVSKILLPGRYVTKDGEKTADQVSKDPAYLAKLLATNSGSLIDPAS